MGKQCSSTPTAASTTRCPATSERPVPAGEVLVEVKAAAWQPGEAMIRQGFLHDRWPATFPSGQGSDFAGVVAETGPGRWHRHRGRRGHRVHRSTSQSGRFVVVPADQLTAETGQRHVGGRRSALCRAAPPRTPVDRSRLAAGRAVAVAGAAGGVGTIAVQLAKRGRHCSGHRRAVERRSADRARRRPVNYGDGLAAAARRGADGGIKRVP